MISQGRTRIIAWVDHDETAVNEVIGKIGALVRLEKDRKLLKDVFRFVPVIVSPEADLATRARERIVHECGRIPDLVLVDLAFGPPDTGGIVEIGRGLAHRLKEMLGPVPVGIYSRYACPRPIKRYHLNSDGFAVVLEDIRKTYDNVNVDECMTGDQWSLLFEKVIGGGGYTNGDAVAGNDGIRDAHLGASQTEIAVKGTTDVGIITVREDEFDAVLRRFEDRRTIRGKQHYEKALVTSKEKQTISVAMVRCPEQGQARAQAVANEMIEDLEPKWLMLVGIAGGMPENEFSLGDVVVASRLTDFAVSATLQDKPSEFSVSGGMMHQDVEDFVAHLPAFSKKLNGWNKANAIGRTRPRLTVNRDSTAPEYYGDDDWRKKVIASLCETFPATGRRRGPIYVARPVISSNTLVKSTELAREWQHAARQVAAVEMELTGIYMAAWRSGNRSCRVLAIRGLSDIVGYKRSPEWTRYACETAAAFAHAVIVGGLVSSQRQR
jgi:nucleoside phosphorylase